MSEKRSKSRSPSRSKSPPPKERRASRSRSKGSRSPPVVRDRSPIREIDPTHNKLFVGNLSYETTEREVEDMFTKYGRVTEARLAVDKFSGKPKGFAFVTMDDARDAADAVKGLANYEINGRAVRVEISHGLGAVRKREERSSGYRGYSGRDYDSDRRGSGYDRDRSRERPRDRSRERTRDRSRERGGDRRERRRSRSRSDSRSRR